MIYFQIPIFFYSKYGKKKLYVICQTSEEFLPQKINDRLANDVKNRIVASNEAASVPLERERWSDKLQERLNLHLVSDFFLLRF